MNDFLDLAFSLPAVIFTVSSIFFLGFWMVTTLIGAGADALDDLDFDFDAETDVDLDTDLEIDAAADTNLLRSALEFLGVTNMPLLIALNLLSLSAWLVSMIAMTIVDGVGLEGAVRGIAAVVILVGALLVGAATTRAIGRRFAHVFTPTHALKQRELVGTACTITTSRVSETFGQAEVRDDEGGSLIVQVRCSNDNDLAAGDRVLIFDLDADTGEFRVSPDRSLAP